MPGAQVDFTRDSCDDACEQGLTFNKEIDWLVESPANSGTFIPAVNLTGYTAKMQIKTSAAGTLILELNTSNGRISINGPLAAITLTISAADTTTLPSGVYVYELKLTDVSGNVSSLIFGAFEILAAVTL